MSSEPITVHLIGDSTMAEKSPDERPETGWGMPFPEYLDDAVTVENHARNGRSTKTFLEEGRWEPVVDALTERDYVFVQFGHNDAAVSKDRYTPESEFEANLERFVAETRDRGAEPVLLTPVARRHFDERGLLKDTHRDYSEVTREVARARDAALVDVDGRSQSVLRELGPADSEPFYLHLSPGEHPNYPDGVTDDTHFSERGARWVAELVIDGLEAIDHELASRISHGDR